MALRSQPLGTSWGHPGDMLGTCWGHVGDMLGTQSGLTTAPAGVDARLRVGISDRRVWKIARPCEAIARLLAACLTRRKTPVASPSFKLIENGRGVLNQ